MQDTDLFQMALGLFPPWMVERSTFDPEKKQLDIHLKSCKIVSRALGAVPATCEEKCNGLMKKRLDNRGMTRL